MKKNKVKELWREGKAAIGTWVVLGSPITAEIIANLGFDWIVIDTEHGSIDIETTQSIIQAISTTNTVPMVRVPWNDPALIKRALDAGAYGLVIPMVNTREDAIKAVQASRYPPLGARSYGGPRVRLYGGDEYFYHSNEEIALIVQIEHVDAVDNIDAILSVEGVDAFFIGPNDLAASMGIKLGFDNPDPRHKEAVDKVVIAGKKHKIPSGILVGSPEAANQRMEQGFQFIDLSSDEGFLRSAASSALGKVKQDRKIF
ncbi:HpcH/HpaI aldolase/citrate lyase family protein [Chloroflexota bacterium]